MKRKKYCMAMIMVLVGGYQMNAEGGLYTRFHAAFMHAKLRYAPTDRSKQHTSAHSPARHFALTQISTRFLTSSVSLEQRDVAPLSTPKHVPTTVLFNFTDVVAQINPTEVAKQISWSDFANYGGWSLRSEEGRKTVQDAITKKVTDTAQLLAPNTTSKEDNCYGLPERIYEWYCGRRESRALIDEVQQFIDTHKNNLRYFKSEVEARLTAAGIRMFADPATRTAMYKPNQNIIPLAKQLKHNGRKIGIFANAHHENIRLFLEKNPELQELFSFDTKTQKGNIITSSITGVTKPSDKAFNHAFAGERPQDFLIVDDVEEVVKKAQNLGAQTFHYKKDDPDAAKKLAAHLQDVGALPGRT